MPDHPLTHFRRRHTARARLHVFVYVLDPGGRRYGAGKRRMADNALEQEIRPGAAIKLLHRFQVPMPITGMRSLLDGIGFLGIPGDVAVMAGCRVAAVAPAATRLGGARHVCLGLTCVHAIKA